MSASAIRPGTVEPNACALCGVPRSEHGQRSGLAHSGGNPRAYVAPDDATRLARMRERNQRRLTNSVSHSSGGAS